MYLHKNDLKLISEIVSEFPDVDTFKLESDSSSGIGSVLKLIVSTKIMDRDADVTFEISGVENW